MKSLKEITMEILNKGELEGSLEQALIRYCEEQNNTQSYIYEIAFCYGRALQLILSDTPIKDVVKLFFEEDVMGDFTTYEMYKDMLVKIKEKTIPEIYNKDLDTLRKENEEYEKTIKSKIKETCLDINKEYKSPIVTEWVKKAREINQRQLKKSNEFSEKELRVLYKSHKEIEDVRNILKINMNSKDDIVVTLIEEIFDNKWSKRVLFTETIKRIDFKNHIKKIQDLAIMHNIYFMSIKYEGCLDIGLVDMLINNIFKDYKEYIDIVNKAVIETKPNYVYQFDFEDFIKEVAKKRKRYVEDKSATTESFFERYEKTQKKCFEIIDNYNEETGKGLYYELIDYLETQQEDVFNYINSHLCEMLGYHLMFENKVRDLEELKDVFRGYECDDIHCESQRMQYELLKRKDVLFGKKQANQDNILILNEDIVVVDEIKNSKGLILKCNSKIHVLSTKEVDETKWTKILYKTVYGDFKQGWTCNL